MAYRLHCTRGLTGTEGGVRPAIGGVADDGLFSTIGDIEAIFTGQNHQVPRVPLLDHRVRVSFGHGSVSHSYITGSS